jgi:enamine deaminase RidA (YjgF/YER057c/UK114 family)
MERSIINPAALAAPHGYSHVVTAKGAGKTVFISGQVAWNAKGDIVGKGDLRAQTIQAYENLKTALAAAGASFSDMVKMNTYVVNLRPEDVAVIREVRSRYLPADKPPASTLIGVQALVVEGLLIEVEAVAVVD